MYLSSRPLQLLDREVDGWRKTISVRLIVDTTNLWVGVDVNTRSGWSGFFRNIDINLLPCISIHIRIERPSKTVYRADSNV